MERNAAFGRSTAGDAASGRGAGLRRLFHFLGMRIVMRVCCRFCGRPVTRHARHGLLARSGAAAFGAAAFGASAAAPAAPRKAPAAFRGYPWAQAAVARRAPCPGRHAGRDGY
jgi:hypothetical protein